MGYGKHKFVCPTCKSQYQIDSYPGRVCDDECAVLNCSECPLTLVISLNEWDQVADLKKSKAMGFEPYTEEILRPCRCGGEYKFSAKHRCAVCLSEVEIEEIKKQIDWWGSADGTPGITMSVSYSSNKCWK